MKSFTRLCAPASIFVALALGCTTAQLNTGLALAAELAGNAATYATRADLAVHPDHRGAFEAAKIALDGLLRSSDYSRASFSAALRQLPIAELRGNEGCIDASLIVFDVLTQLAFDVQSAPAVAKIMAAVRDGLVAGLAIPLPDARKAEPEIKASRAAPKRFIQL